MRAQDGFSEALLTLWETALLQPASVRAEAMLRSALAGNGPARTLGERNAHLVDLHSRLFGSSIDLRSTCPTCAAVAEFRCDCNVLSDQIRPNLDGPPPHRFEAQDHSIEFRFPTGADVEVATSEPGEGDFVQRMLERCVLSCAHQGEDVPIRRIPEPLLEALSEHMGALDPGASLSFSLQCPDCSAHWSASLDVADVVWQKVRAAAERLLLDIDALARAYGWTEREVLRLTPVRRAAYLQMVAS